MAEEPLGGFATENEFFGGSYALAPIADATGISVDKLNFLVCQIIGLLLGIPFRTSLGPHSASPTVRHLIQISVGTAMAIFCFGLQIKHLFFQAIVAYIMMSKLPRGVMEKSVLVYCMGYLCVCHIYRMYYDYGGYTLDITGPLMVSTQRLTSLAYNLADGKTKQRNPETKISPAILRYAVDSLPSALEFASYILTFNGMMCGPFCMYTDYKAFICGTNYKQPASSSSGDRDTTSLNGGKAPNPTGFVLQKLAATAVCGFLAQVLAPYFTVYYLLDKDFKSRCIVYRMIYVVISTSLARAQYYFAWKLAEAVNANSGLGFYYDADGHEKWNMVENADIAGVEFSQSLKTLLDSWNKMTSLWLRLIVYERTHNSLLVFLFSAAWHGFYAGYYLTFFFGGVFVYAGRLIRRNIRPLFQQSKSMAHLYDVLTFFATRVAIAYLVIPFMLLEFWTSMEVYANLYFWLHIVTVLLAVVLQFKPWKSGAKKTE